MNPPASEIPEVVWIVLVFAATFAAVFFFAHYAVPHVKQLFIRQHAWYDRVLNHQLLLNTDPKAAIGMSILGSIIFGMVGYLLMESFLGFLIFAAAAQLLPNLIVNHLESKRNQKLQEQIVDGINCLASGVRAGLNLQQSMELLTTNSTGPIKQEFAQLLREYAMGLDLNSAMRNTANRINLGSYRLLFTALEMHRKRGGDAGQTLDRISESIREIQRLEGKLDALTAQGRFQAYGMAAMPAVILGVYYLIDSMAVRQMLADPSGRIIMIVVGVLIFAGYSWIRRIMDVDI